MNCFANKKQIIDLLIAIVLVALFCVLGIGAVNQACSWGDDFAAYINEGIAIANGKWEEQSVINYFLHPAPYAQEAIDTGKITYAWGLPATLSLVYKIVGYDTVHFNSIIFYKIPALVCFSLLAGVLYLFYRNYLGRLTSIVLVIAFGTFIDYYYILNNVMTDIIFLFMAVLNMELLTLLKRRKSWILAVLFALALWYTWELRLNGMIVVGVCFVGTLLDCIKNKYSLRDLVKPMFPYVLCVILVMVSQMLIGTPTTEASKMGSITASGFWYFLTTYVGDIGYNFRHVYLSVIVNPIYSLLGVLGFSREFNSELLINIFLWITFAMIIIGIVSTWSIDNIHLFLFCIVLVGGSSLYYHDERYIFPILPIIYLYFGCGITFLIRKIKLKIPGEKPIKIILCAIASILILKPIVQYGQTIDFWDNTIYGAYSDTAKEAYTYIRENTEEDAVIAFFRPRCLYLNTGRLSFQPYYNDRKMDEADYYLDFKYREEKPYPMNLETTKTMEQIFENDSFVLYKLISE